MLRRAAADPDVQVRRLAIRAASAPRIESTESAAAVLRQGLADAAPMVRLEALRSIKTISARAPDAPVTLCDASISGVGDRDPHVALAGARSACRLPRRTKRSPLLDRAVTDLSQPPDRRAAGTAPRTRSSRWPARSPSAAPLAAAVTGSSVWQLRMYAARAAAILKDRAALEKLARDGDDNVTEAAIEGLAAVSGHDADAVYVEALATGRYQVGARGGAWRWRGHRVRGQAIAGAAGALTGWLLEGRDNSQRRADGDWPTRCGDWVRQPPPRRGGRRSPTADLTAAELRSVAAARPASPFAASASSSWRCSRRGAGDAVRFARLAEPATTTA